MATALQDLLSNEDVEGFCARFFDLYGGEPGRLSALFKEACLYAGSCLYPDQYFPPHYFVPHSFTGLIAAWQARQYLQEADRWRPLLQGLWHLSREVRSFGVYDRKPSVRAAGAGRPADAARELADAAASQDPDRFFSVYAACLQHPRLRKFAIGTLLSIALRDFTNIGHKYIYALKTAQLSQSSWADPAVFYPPVHFLFIAPKDHHISDAVRQELESHHGAIPLSGRRRITYRGALQLRDAIVGGDRDVPGLLLGLMADGYSVRSIGEALSLVASHIVYYAPDTGPEEWWLYPVHGVNFTQSVNLGLGLLPYGDRLFALLTTGRYLKEMAQRTGGVRIDGSLEGASAQYRLTGRSLDRSSAMRDIVASVGLQEGLPGGGETFDRLAERLALLAVRKERFLFSHTIKYLTFLLGALRDRPGSWAADHLLTFARFLAATPEAETVMTVAENVAKVNCRG